MEKKELIEKEKEGKSVLHGLTDAGHNNVTDMDSPLPDESQSEPTDPIAAKMGQSSQIGLRSDDQDEFTNAKQFPEDPFSYQTSKNEHVQLNSGNVQYEVTDFELPGRDGFDVKITRRYDSGCANLTDMDPYITWDRMRTGTRDNSHNTQKYGLGYGWSFVLPSIETIYNIGAAESYSGKRSTTIYSYTLHLEDGRSLEKTGKRICLEIIR